MSVRERTGAAHTDLHGDPGHAEGHAVAALRTLPHRHRHAGTRRTQPARQLPCAHQEYCLQKGMVIIVLLLFVYVSFLVMNLKSF